MRTAGEHVDLLTTSWLDSFRRLPWSTMITPVTGPSGDDDAADGGSACTRTRGRALDAAGEPTWIRTALTREEQAVAWPRNDTRAVCTACDISGGLFFPEAGTAAAALICPPSVRSIQLTDSRQVRKRPSAGSESGTCTN